MKLKDLFTEKPIITIIKSSLLLSVIINGFAIFTHYYAVSEYGYGGLFLLWLSVFAAIPLLLAILIIPFSILGLIITKLRRISLGFLIFCVIYFIIGIPCIRLCFMVRMNGFKELAERSTSLITAIKNYERKYGQPPRSLETLVPEFMDKIPTTKMPAYPDYEYKVLSINESRHYGENPWIILVYCGSGGVNFDMFLYFPKQNYPTEGYGGCLEIINNWAYVHE